MTKAHNAAMTGIIVLNKPSGITSRRLVDQVARLVPRLKVGHAGTLDPLATGILIVCIGPATRLVEYLQALPKSYRTVVRLGARSDTLDADGRIEPAASPRIPSLTEIHKAIVPLEGTVIQKPPSYSALKIEGQRSVRPGAGWTNCRAQPAHGPDRPDRRDPLRLAAT